MSQRFAMVRSLRLKMLAPMLAASALIVCSGLYIFHAQAQAHLESQLHRRAATIVNRFIQAAKSASDTRQIQQLALATAVDDDVLDFLVSAGDPLRIVGTARKNWLGLPLSAIPNEEFGDDLRRAISQPAPSWHLNDAQALFDYSTSLQLQSLGETPGAVMVHLDARELRAFIRLQAQQLALTFAAALAFIAALGYLCVDKYVLQPLSRIGQQLLLPQLQLTTAWRDETRDDEIGALARSLRNALLRSETALHDLAQQKFALDQHSIVAVTDVRGKITYVNDKFCAISKFSREELLGQDHRIVSSGAHPKSFFTALWRVILRGEVWHGEIQNRAKDGTFYWVDTTIVPFNDATGKPVQFIAIRTDVTQRKQNKEALLAAKSQAEAAAAAKSVFLANMSHEIRTPMNAVIGMTALLLETDLADDQRELLEIVRNNGEVLLEVINDILDYSKLEANKLELEPHPFDLRELLDSVTDLFAIQARSKKLDLIVHANPSVPVALVGDVTRVRQILFNLVGNALKFTTAGEVEVVVSCGTQSQDEATLVFSVRDTGVGIPDDKLRSLFRSFTQVDGSTTRRFGGSGLGLAISKRLAEMMGGRVRVESTLNEGSTFYFECRFNVAAASANEELRSPARSLKGARVLIADDNASCRGFIQRELEQLGAAVQLAASLAEAAETLQRWRAQVIVADNLLPECAPGELARAMRTALGNTQAPIVLLNPHSSVQATYTGFAQQAPKPLKTRQLLAAIQSVLEQPSEEPAPPKTESACDQALAQRHPLRILLAEDNPINQRVLVLMLARMGYQIRVVETGAEAVAAVAAEKFDLIFMDVHMPDVDGLEATRRIRALEPTHGRRPRIVALTASVLEEERLAAVAAGMDDFLCKPVKTAELQHAIAFTATASNAAPTRAVGGSDT